MTVVRQPHHTIVMGDSFMTGKDGTTVAVPAMDVTPDGWSNDGTARYRFTPKYPEDRDRDGWHQDGTPRYKSVSGTPT